MKHLLKPPQGITIESGSRSGIYRIYYTGFSRSHDTYELAFSWVSAKRKARKLARHRDRIKAWNEAHA